MRPAKLIPPHLLPQSKQSRPYAIHTRIPYARGGSVAPILAIIATVVLSVVYFVAIRTHNVQLSFKQLSEFERHVQTGGNRSVYFVELPSRDEFLTSFTPDEWQKLSGRIDYVVFLYDDLEAVGSLNGWVPLVTAAFSRMKPPGYGISLFACGCVVPNVIFTRTRTRFDGYECTMLPGFVIPDDAVAFVNVSMTDKRCRRRDAFLSFRWYQMNAWKLQAARKEHKALRAAFSSEAT